MVMDESEHSPKCWESRRAAARVTNKMGGHDVIDGLIAGGGCFFFMRKAREEIS